MNLNENVSPSPHKGGVSQNDFQCSSQPWRIRKFRVNLFVLPFGDCIGIPHAHNYLIYKKGGSNFITIHQLLQYSSGIVTVAFVYDKSPEGKANRAFWNARVFRRAIPNKDAIFAIFSANFVWITSFTRAFFFCSLAL